MGYMHVIIQINFNKVMLVADFKSYSLFMYVMRKQ